MNGKLKIVGFIFLACLALGAGWALWMGLKALAWIVGAGFILGLGVTLAMSVRSRRG
jgi:hypothetical protein